MRFRVQHSTSYSYSCPVSLGTHVIRLLPQRCSVSFHDLRVVPAPVSKVVRLDPFGNEVAELAFAGSTSEFTIDSQFEAETSPTPSVFDGALPPLPWSDVEVATGSSDPVHVLARELAAEVGHRPIEFLDHLCRTLYTRIDRHIRLEGHAQTAGETLATLRGACRDITVLFLECCRVMGVSGRFVSGYQATADTPDGHRHLHAWPEVWLGRHGWHGWDATHGIRVGEGHLTLCAAPTQSETMPVEGGFSFIGAEITSQLSFAVSIQVS